MGITTGRTIDLDNSFPTILFKCRHYLCDRALLAHDFYNISNRGM